MWCAPKRSIRPARPSLRAPRRRSTIPAAPAARGRALTAPALPASGGAAIVRTARRPTWSSNSVQTAPVVSGHTLWALSQNYYGDPTRYPLIYEANKAEIHNPNLIYPGQVFVVPKFEPKP